MAYGEPGAVADRIKVFISYSRADTEFALDLVSALQACGFEAYIDQEDIAPGEPWEQRLGGLIEAADTIVYVMSPDSIGSMHCDWEVAESLRRSKRLLPVVWRAVPDDAAPRQLRRLNYTFFTGKNSFAAGLKELSQALRVDIGWIREHTRIGALARRWDARGRSDALLLRGDELEAAKTWSASTPRGAPELTVDQVDFIAASNAAHDAAERRARNRRRGLVLGVSTVAVAMTGLAAFAWMQYLDANKARDFAVQAYDELSETNDALQSAFLRLSADIALRAPPTAADAFEVAGGWFPVAANYSGAVVRLDGLSGPQRAVNTGFLIEGRLVHSDFADQTLILAPELRPGFDYGFNDMEFDALIAAAESGDDAWLANFDGVVLEKDFDPGQGAGRILEQRAISEVDIPPAVEDAADPLDGFDDRILEQRFVTDAPPGFPDDEMSIVATFPTLDTSGAYLVSETPVWTTPPELAAETRFAVYVLEEAAPFGARAVTAADLDCGSAEGGVQSETAYALFGIDSETAQDADGESEGLTLLVAEAVDVGAWMTTYRHTVMKGVFGAPVFDLDTGKIVGVHIGIQGAPKAPDRRVGVAQPVVHLLNQVRDQVSLTRRNADRTRPLCF